MKKLTFGEILEVLKEKIGDVNEFAYEDYNEEDLELGKVEEVEQVGGEDQGSTWYSVKHFKDHDVYIRVDGWYSSYEGTDFNGWEDCKEVRPQEKVITVYE